MPRRTGGHIPASHGFTIRRATDADLDLLAEHRNSMYREMVQDQPLDLRAYKRKFKAWARKMIRRKKFVSFLVSDGNGKTVAGGSVWIREYQPSPRYPGTEQPYLMSMFTDAGYRRKGLATMIVKEAIDWSRKRGYIRLNLHASQMGKPVYAKLGFERTTEMRFILDNTQTRNVRPSEVPSRRQ